VLNGLEDRNQIVRFAAAFAAGELKLVDVRPQLLNHLSDPDPRVRVAIRFALHKLGDPSRTSDLEGYAQSYDASKGLCSGATAFVLGRLGEPSAVGVLRLLRIDDNPVVRLQAEESLFLLGDSRAEKAITALTISRFPDDRCLGCERWPNVPSPGSGLSRGPNYFMTIQKLPWSRPWPWGQWMPTMAMGSR